MRYQSSYKSVNQSEQERRDAKSLTIDITLFRDSRNVDFLVFHILQQVCFVPRVKLLVFWLPRPHLSPEEPKKKKLTSVG